MNVLIIGSGGREHALAFKIKESANIGNLFVAPGNAGTSDIADNVKLNINDKSEIFGFIREHNIEFVVVGPEQPLVDGIADILRENGVVVFGPGAKAAQIESDKAFAKQLMQKFNVPTAAYSVFNSEQYKDAVNFINNNKYPLVIKANGLTAGKGVAICSIEEEARKTLDEYFIDKKFGASGETIVIEEFLEGEEASIFAITDGKDFYLLPASQDHKRIGENDTGVNTGGMGAYAPAPLVTDSLLQIVNDRIISPIISGMNEDGIPFIGCLYAGLMIHNNEPKVVEFNCRFGDPETQAVLPLLQGDFLQLLYSAASGNIDKDCVQYNGGSAVCVILASSGYPGKYEKGKVITGLDVINNDEIIVFHAGTRKENDSILTNGGRVLGVTSLCKENNLNTSISMVYNNIDKVDFEGKYYRKDIGKNVKKFNILKIIKLFLIFHLKLI